MLFVAVPQLLVWASVPPPGYGIMTTRYGGGRYYALRLDLALEIAPPAERPELVEVSWA